MMGRPALEALLRDATLPEPDWSRLGGQFVALVQRGGRSFLLTDYFAVFQLFHDREMPLFSTSLLSAAAALPRLSFDPQGVYEFAFNVVADRRRYGVRRAQDARPRPDRRAPARGRASRTTVGQAAARTRPPRCRWRSGSSATRRGSPPRSGPTSATSATGSIVPCPAGSIPGFCSPPCAPRAAVRSVYVYGCPEERRRPHRPRDRRGARLRGRLARQGGAARSRPTNSPSRSSATSSNMTACPIRRAVRERHERRRPRRPPRRRRALRLRRLRRDLPQLLLPRRPADLAPPRSPGPSSPATPRGDVTGAFDERAFLRAIEDKILAALGAGRATASGCRGRWSSRSIRGSAAGRCSGARSASRRATAPI